MRRLPFVFFVSALIGSLSLGVLWSTVAQADSKRHFTLEVAMDGPTGGVNPAVINPPRSTVVIVNGTIYPKGTLPSGESQNDPNEPGGIGTWRCHFAHLGPIDFPLVGAVTYFFQLESTGHGQKESMIMAQGLNSHTPELQDSVPRVLAVVGGTGRYAGATGVVREEVIGTNMSGSRNLRFKFRLRGVRHGHN